MAGHVERQAAIEWSNGQQAVLSLAAGWAVNPPDDVLGALLNSRYSLEAVQSRRASPIPDLLATAAKAAALATGAEVVRVDPPLAVPIHLPA
ncbi:MAG: hypothetical protein ACRDHG_01765 [Anaerolineales bacterium]